MVDTRKIHYDPLSSDFSACGINVYTGPHAFTVRLTINPARATCLRCRRLMRNGHVPGVFIVQGNLVRIPGDTPRKHWPYERL